MSRINTAAYKLIDEVHDDINRIVKNGMTGKRRTLLALKGEIVDICSLSVQSSTWRSWRRGDGSTYHEPHKIKLGSWHKIHQREYSTYKTHFPTAESVYDFVWEKLKARRGAKEIGELSTEFGKPYSPAITSGGVLWVKRPWGIEYGSIGRLKNTSVWSLKNTVN